MHAKKLLRAAEEVARHKRGEVTLDSITVSPPRVDVKSIRLQLGATQAEFAARFGFTVAAVRNWEQGVREPEGAARLLLALIQQNPGLIERELKKLKAA